ncbi:hypothetical protein K32_10560 [Kaistia sp. 32K]|nr:hypothetical protein K32_10560 [Kaistia sp. 32K]
MVSFPPFILAVLGGAIFSAIMGAIQHQSGVDILLQAALLAGSAQVGYAAGLILLALARTTRSPSPSRRGTPAPTRSKVDRMPPEKELL